MDKNGAAYLAAGFATHNDIVAVATDYLTWLEAQRTLETGINALLAASNHSNRPDAVLTKADEYYELFEADPPLVNSVTAATGSTAGGTVVTIAGRDFLGATAVTFGGTAATAVTVNSDTSITCTTPAKTAGAVTVAVTTPAGTGSKAAAYTYA